MTTEEQKTLNHWHRRAQKAEAELCITAEERARQGQSIGRGLAGATWQHYKDRAEQAEATVARLETRVGELCEAHEAQFLRADQADARADTLREVLEKALATFRARDASDEPYWCYNAKPVNDLLEVIEVTLRDSEGA